jgi:hypothetical protein
MKHKNVNIGSVSSGTMRPEDLIPEFIYELRRQKPLSRGIRRELRSIEKEMEQEDFYEQDAASYALEYLFDTLDTFSPEGFYFGAHPGDGADYGFWLSESFVEDFDGLKVDDLSEVPKGFTGSVLQVNDHGNISLYSCWRGRLREQWAIV